MSHRQIMFSILLTIVSLVVGYYLNVLANKTANKQFMVSLREELDIIDSHYERILAESGSINEQTRTYLQGRRAYLNSKLKQVEQKM